MTFLNKIKCLEMRKNDLAAIPLNTYRFVKTYLDVKLISQHSKLSSLIDLWNLMNVLNRLLKRENNIIRSCDMPV